MDAKWKKWLISLAITTAAALVMKFVFPVPNLILIETAPNAWLMQNHILKIPAHHGDVYHLLFWNTITDYAFLLGYSFLTYFSIVILLNIFSIPITAWVWVASFATGFFDIQEDNFLINTALRHQEDFSMLYYYIVRIKWAFAMIPLMVISVTLAYGIFLVSSAKQTSTIRPI